MSRPLIVLIDDDKFMRKFLALSLNKTGYEVHEAEDGASGVALVLAKKPHVVICDEVMPGMPGHEVYRKIRSSPGHEHTPFVLLSGDDVTLPTDKAARALKKPIDPNLLGQILSEWAPVKSAA